jgi:glycosyltransferase involved in cell wall biosynthesis
MKNILVISYFAPPLNLPPAIRIGKFAKYLPEFGWNPIILTVKEIDFYQKNLNLFPDYESMKIERTKCFDYFHIVQALNNLFGKDDNISQIIFKHKENKIISFIKKMFPIDDKIGWMPFCYSKAKKIIKTQKIDAIFTTLGGVYHSAITSYLLAEKFNLPLIIEFRDLWVDYPLEDVLFFNKKINSYFEKKIVNYASKIITLAPGAKRILNKKYDIDADKIEVITNGFDADDFKDNISFQKKENTLIFTFCGTFFTKLTPEDLFISLKKINVQNIKIKIRFIGNFRRNIWELKNKFEKQFSQNISIQLIPRMGYRQLINELYKSDILMLFVEDNDMLHAKIFDYLVTKKAILAFCPKESDTENIIKKGNLGFTIENGNIVQGVETIENIIQLFKENKLSKIHGNDDYIKQFTRKNLTKKFAKILDNLL